MAKKKNEIKNGNKARTADRNNEAEAEKAGAKSRRLLKILIPAAAALAILLSVILPLAITAGGGKVDYLKDDLGKYITLNTDDYKGFKTAEGYESVADAQIERQIMNLLYKNRDTKPQYNGGNITNLPITVGDTAWIFYRGYTVGEDGRQKDIPNATNFFSSLQALDIGSLHFIDGFEEGLIGKNPADYKKFELINSGTVEGDNVIYITYEAMLPNGTTKSAKLERVDLSDPDVDKYYGEGFREYCIGSSIGVKKESKTFPLDIGRIVYYDVKVEYATDCEASPLKIEARFPDDYSEVSLRGTKATFDVFVRYINVYNTPEYNDAFVKDTLKITEEELAGYEGETLVDRHRASIEYELTVEAFWNYMADAVTVNKLPERDVEVVYEEYYYEIYAMYANYSSSFSSVDEFAATYYQLPEGESWLDHIRGLAERDVTDKLVFYYIAREEGFLPEGELYDELYEGVVAEYLSYYTEDIYKSELDKIKDPAEREKRLSEIKAEMLDYYGEDYFREMVYYDHALPQIIKLG